jgi:hypothetical protein
MSTGGILTTCVEFVLGLIGHFVARPLAKYGLLLALSFIVGGVTTFFVVAVVVVLSNWLWWLTKIFAVLVLFFLTTGAVFMYLNEDAALWDQVVRDPSLGWNVTRSYICGGLAHVTHKPIWQCPGVLPANITNASLVIL